MRFRKVIRKSLYLALTLYSTGLLADWTVDPEGSYVGFASVKNDLIAENHSFTAVSGGVAASGEAKIEIALTSVETLIPLRNDRMLSMLFETNEFPVAKVSSQVPVNDFTALAVGESMTLSIDLMVNLHGTNLKKPVLVKVTNNGNNNFDVTSLGPIVIHASQLALADGVEALRKIAGLQSIDLMVPVTFDLHLTSAE